ncbi:oxygen-binding di-iron domain-containing protein [Roseomonas elaeocarpi]|uniref:ODP domain-containing protein n=1 Tax=Roseomonas elaeocarpi TaxID=907779 RepID=A0ABV6JNB6_9PROT
MSALPREISPGLFWLGDCQVQRVRGKVYHGYNAAYLLIGGQASCLLETGAPKDFPLLKRQIDSVLDSSRPPLRHIFLSHQETPHAGGLSRLMDLFPEVTLHGDLSDYHLVVPEHAHRFHWMEAGHELDLGGRSLVTVDPVIRDLRSTLWAFDTRDHVLFPADGFAYSHFHTEGHCGLLAEEATNLDLQDGSAVFAERALFWTKFVDMKPYIDRFERLVADLDVRMIAPTHGLPVGDVARTMPLVMEGLRFGSREEMLPQGELAQSSLDQEALAAHRVV